MIPKKRFWKDVTVAPVEAGFEVRLDDRPLRTPLKSQMILPTVAVADLVAGEWDAVEDEINPAVMPANRMSNSAIDTVALRKDDVAAMLSEYAGTDLLCYWAEGPEALIARQRAEWQPILEWVSQHYAAPVATTSGIMPIAQDPRLRAGVHAEILELEPFEIAGLHDVLVLSGSAFLAMAWFHDAIEKDQVWALSRIDAEWQIAQWGEDEDEAARVAIKHSEFDFAAKFCRLARSCA
ncbi:MAG: ATP12 family protein [Pseudomonadota bacterium]